MKSKRRIFTLQQVLQKVYTCSFVHVSKINSIGNKEMECISYEKNEIEKYNSNVYLC